MTRTRIFTRIDFDKQGKQVDWLYLPHSVTRSAYGHISIPIAVFANGTGPTALVMAGNHGDEYEGQIALARLIRTFDPATIRGRVIVMPAVNLPAALDSARVSPIDGINLNRSFPGDPDGTPTLAIAHYIDSVLFPMADYVLDLHAGGTSLDYLPYASMRLGDDADLNARTIEALKAFAPPIGIIWSFSTDARLAHVAAIRRRTVALGGEFGGGGGVSPAGIRLIDQGLTNFLAHAGIMPPDTHRPAVAPTRLMEIRSMDYYVLAPDAGLFEPAVELGQEVEAGDLCGHVHFVDNPMRAPEPCHFRIGGMVICRRHLGRVERGDCVVHLATDRAAP